MSFALPLSPPVSPSKPRAAASPRRGNAVAALPFFSSNEERVKALLDAADKDVAKKASVASRVLETSATREAKWASALTADEQRVARGPSVSFTVEVQQEAQQLVRSRGVSAQHWRALPSPRRPACSPTPQPDAACTPFLTYLLFQVNGFVQTNAQELVRRFQREAERATPASAGDVALRRSATAHGVTASLQSGMTTFQSESWRPTPMEVYDAVAASSEARGE